MKIFFDEMAKPLEGGGGKVVERVVEEKDIVMDFDDVLHLHSFLQFCFFFNYFIYLFI